MNKIAILSLVIFFNLTAMKSEHRVIIEKATKQEQQKLFTYINDPMVKEADFKDILASFKIDLPTIFHHPQQTLQSIKMQIKEPPQRHLLYRSGQILSSLSCCLLTAYQIKITWIAYNFSKTIMNEPKKETAINIGSSLFLFACGAKLYKDATENKIGHRRKELKDAKLSLLKSKIKKLQNQKKR